MKRAFLKSPLAFSSIGAFVLVTLSLTGAKNVTPGEVMWQEGVIYRTEGHQFQQQGNLEQAADAYRKAILVKPDYAEAYNDLGVILESTGDSAGAEDAYKTALKFKPDLGPAHSNLALLYEETNRIQEAAVHWAARSRMGSPSDPWVIKAREKLARYNLEIPKTKEEETEKRTMEIRAVIEAGKADLEAQQYSKAVSEFERALKMDPSNSEATRLLRSAKIRVQREQARQERELEAAKGRIKREIEESKRKEAAREAKTLWEQSHSQQASGQMKALEEARRKAAEQKAQEAESGNMIEAAKQIEAEKRAEEIKKRAVTPVEIAAPEQESAAPSEAQEIARQIIMEKSKLRGQTAQELNRRASAAMRDGRYQDAVDTYKQMLMLDPGNRSAKQGLKRAQKALAKEAQ